MNIGLGLGAFVEICSILGEDSIATLDTLKKLNIETVEALKDYPDLEAALKKHPMKYITRKNLLDGVSVLREKYPPKITQRKPQAAPSSAAAEGAAEFSASERPGDGPEMDLATRHLLADCAAANDFDAVIRMVEADPRQVNAARPGGKSGWTLLHQAASYGNYDGVKKLLELKADPSLRSKDDSTAAALAEEYGQTKIAELIHRAEKEQR
jgi:hypothetical protein